MTTQAETRTAEILSVPYTLHKLQKGTYLIRNPEGLVVGTARHRRRDWYSEIAIGEEYYNCCEESLFACFYSLGREASNRRRYVLGKGKSDSIYAARRLRRDIFKYTGQEIPQTDVDAVVNEVMARDVPQSAPMVTVPPPTPITARDNTCNAMSKLEHAIALYGQYNVNCTPLWSAMQDAHGQLQTALSKMPKI